MNDLTISHLIYETCKKLEIRYYSPDLKGSMILAKDIEGLDILFYQIKEIIFELKRIQVKHNNLGEFNNLMDKIINSLNIVDQDIEKEKKTLTQLKKKLKFINEKDGEK